MHGRSVRIAEHTSIIAETECASVGFFRDVLTLEQINRVGRDNKVVDRQSRPLQDSVEIAFRLPNERIPCKNNIESIACDKQMRRG